MTSATRPCVLVVAEHRQGKLVPITYELFTCAREIQKVGQFDLAVAILGDHVQALAHEIADTVGVRVFAVHGPGLGLYCAQTYQEALETLFRELQPTFVCIAHTAQGLDFAPGLAVRLQAACISGIEKVLVKDGRVCFSRLAFNGKIQLDVYPHTATTVLTVSSGAFTPAAAGQQGSGAIVLRDYLAMPTRYRSLGLKRSHEGSALLTTATVVVAAGRGIGRRENLELIERLAALFPRSVVAGSRPVCDLGFLPYANQVGMTGTSVTPKLYFACGISGASQHVVGMRGSEFVVAISKDPNAAIFNVADICIVEDLIKFIPLLIEKHRKSS